MFLAMSPDEEMRKLFEQEIKRDDLIRVVDTDANVLGYNTEAQNAGFEFHKRLKTEQLFLNSEGKPVHLGGTWAQQTCVIAGSSVSQDTEFIQSMKDHEALIISVGNALQDIVPHVWVGKHSPSSYTARAYQSPAWMSVVPIEHATEQLWDARKELFMEVTPSDCPHTLFYNQVDHKTFLAKPGITDCETNSSLMIAISTAACLGFTNIILTGVDLGGDLDSYFYFDEVPHKETVERKKIGYSLVRDMFWEFNEVLLKHAIRVVCTKDIGLGIPVIPGDYLKNFVGKSSKVRSAIPAGITTPRETKQKQQQSTQERKNAVLTAVHLWNVREELKKELPVFNGPAAQGVYDRLDAALAKPGGCSGCAKNKLTKPLMRLFVEEYQKDSDNLEDVWMRVLPEKWLMKVGKDLVTRSDRA
jgi:hypothetical protein